jgi:nucleotide-binding universal stress UspA family protein
VLETAHDLAERVDATVMPTERGVDLLIVGSRPEARTGRVMVSAQAQNAIENATSPVIVLARSVPLRFAVPAVV